MISTAAAMGKTRRLELILRQIDTLPTLPAIAARLLSLTVDEESSAREVIELVKADQALTAKVLSMCRRADLGVRTDDLSVDRAVVLLGFNAIRNAVLSVKIFEAFAGREPDDPQPPNVRFQREAFWLHSLAVAVCAERLALAHRGRADIPPTDAFVCGLLHDMGKLALDMVLPHAYGRVVELTDLGQSNIADVERRVLALDHHTAGKRLAEHWQLPQRLQDCIWLHGTPYALLPALEHKGLVGLIGLADALARRQHVGYSGNHEPSPEPEAMAEELGLDWARVMEVTGSLYEELDRRRKLLGLLDKPPQELCLLSIQQANERLGRMNAVLERRSQAASRQARVLSSIADFQGSIRPGVAALDVLAAVAGAAEALLGEGYYGSLFQEGPGQPWLICEYGPGGTIKRSQYVEPPPHAETLTDIDASDAPMQLMGLLPWLADYVLGAADLRRVRLLPLSSIAGTAAMLLHDREALPPAGELTALTRTWGAAVAGAAQQEATQRLGEELAEANRQLAAMQERLVRTETMARLGELAAGAAHEMNNPLAIICGRAQLLAQSLPSESKGREAAGQIAEQAHRLSDLITELQRFADPPKPKRQPVQLAAMLHELVGRVKAGLEEGQKDVHLSLQVDAAAPPVMIDRGQVTAAVAELLHNALQAGPKSVHITARIGPSADVVTVQVCDDGCGMDPQVLAHAMDPFFSHKAAGRRMGMGLPRAQQIAKSHGGDVRLLSEPGRGTVATMTLGVAA